MTENNQKQLGKTLWAIADQLRGAMNADDFCDYMLAFLFLRYLSDNYQQAAKKELGRDYPDPNAIENGGRSSLSVWYEQNPDDVSAFERQMRLKAHYVIRPEHLWAVTVRPRRGCPGARGQRTAAVAGNCLVRHSDPTRWWDASTVWPNDYESPPFEPPGSGRG